MNNVNVHVNNLFINFVPFFERFIIIVFAFDKI